MVYNRFWFKKDMYGLTIGGGVMNNPGRYLTLLPPINGADAISGSPYFTAESRRPVQSLGYLGHLRLDAQTVHHLPRGVWLSPRECAVLERAAAGSHLRAETPAPSVFASANAGSVVPGTTFVPGPFLSATPGFTCVAGAQVGAPTCGRMKPACRLAIMVKF